MAPRKLLWIPKASDFMMLMVKRWMAPIGVGKFVRSLGWTKNVRSLSTLVCRDLIDPLPRQLERT
jgi:hypothetical protein